jgi:putative pyrimidine permease RutG
MASIFHWREVRPAPSAVVAPDERLPWPQTGAMGVQHVIAMFGATVLAPILMGFDPNVAILMSGIGTLIFFVLVGGRVPSYLGSSFAFIGVVIAATGYAGSGPNANLGVALGGIVACGALYTLIGLAVMATGTRWIERLMPPVVTGSVIAVIGLNLAGIPIKNMASTAFDAWMQGVTFVVAAGVAIVLGFSPKFGALIQAIPLAAMGGVSIVVFGLIAVAGAKIWVDNRVDFADNRNLVVAAITLVLGTGDYTLRFGEFTLGGIGTATFGAIALWALLGRGGGARA